MIEFVCNCGQVNRVHECFSIYARGTGSTGISYECIKCGNVTQINHKYLEGPSLALTLNDNCEIVKAEEFMVDTERRPDKSEMLLNSCLTIKEFNNRHLHLDGFTIVDHLLSETHEKYLDDKEKSNKMWEFMDHIRKYIMRG